MAYQTFNCNSRQVVSLKKCLSHKNKTNNLFFGQLGIRTLSETFLIFRAKCAFNGTTEA